MKKALRKTSAMMCAITVAASSVSLSGFVASAGEPAPTSDYTITIPASLTVANSGWNATDGISAAGTLAEGKKLVVTASSGDEFALVSGENKIGYKLATASTDTEATTSWEFTALSSTAATKPMGIIVDDYSTKPAGDYSDTVTFTATVEEAAIRLTGNTTALTTGTYFVPEADRVKINDLVTVSGDVTLKIGSGATVTFDNGLSIDEDATLNVQNSGYLYINGSYYKDTSTVKGDHGTLVQTGGDVYIQGGFGEFAMGDTGEDGGTALNGSVIIENGYLMVNGGGGGDAGVEDDSDSTGGKGGVAISGDLTVNGGTVNIYGGDGGDTGENGADNTGGNGSVAIEGSLTLNGGQTYIERGEDGIIGEGSENCTAGTGADAYNGTLTLGEIVILYDDDYDELDNNTGTSRVYQGEKKSWMVAEVVGI